MPIIQINMLAGRPLEKRKRLIREVAEATARALEVPISTVRILLQEVPPEHWGVGAETKADAAPAATDAAAGPTPAARG